MNPLKPKHIARITAEKLGLAEEDVQVVVNAYYQDNVRKKLSGVEHLRIDLPLLGTMVVKPWVVARRIQRLEQELDRFDPVTSPQFAGAKARQKIQELNLLKSAQSLLAFEQNRQETIKDSRTHEKPD